MERTDQLRSSYSIFDGNQYERRTKIPIIDEFVQRFNLKDFIVVADSGLISKINLEFFKIIWLFRIILIYLHCEKDLMNIDNLKL